jgi:hypothetical protein
LIRGSWNPRSAHGLITFFLNIASYFSIILKSTERTWTDEHVCILVHVAYAVDPGHVISHVLTKINLKYMYKVIIYLHAISTEYKVKFKIWILGQNRPLYGGHCEHINAQ